MLGNRTFTPASEEWVHVVTPGEHPHSSGVVQVVDGEATRTMVAQFDADKAQPNFPGVLVNYDHNPAGGSKAAGWVKELESRPSGLWARVAFTELGDRLVTDGTYRHLSAEFDHLIDLGNKRVKPLRLCGVALCNDPGIRGMMPLSNRRTATAGTQAARRARLSTMEEVGASAWAGLARVLANRYSISFDKAWEQVSLGCPEIVELATHRDKTPAFLYNRERVALTLDDLQDAMTDAVAIEPRIREELRLEFSNAGAEPKRTVDQLYSAAWTYLRKSLGRDGKGSDFDTAWKEMKQNQPLLWQALVLHFDDHRAELHERAETAREMVAKRQRAMEAARREMSATHQQF